MKQLRRARRLPRSLAWVRDPGAFTLIEAVLGLTVLVVIAVALGGLLASSVVTYSQSRERTLATQLAAEQIELVRRMGYDDVGLVNGNPPGTLQATRSIDVVGLKATVKTQVTYVDDQTPNAYRTYANYKRVVVTVVRTRDSKQLARESTYVSAASRASAEESVITPTVLDLGDNTPVAGATVNLSTGPSAPRVDVTDVSGKVTFPGLTPNPSSGAQAYYDLAVTPPSGYHAFRDDISPSGAAHVQLGVADEWATTLRLYRPSTIDISVPTPPSGVPYTISVGSGRGAQAFEQAAGVTTRTITSLTSGQSAAEPLVPAPSAASSSQYMVGVSAVSGGSYYYSTAVAKAVPSSYPSNLTQTFSLPAGTWYAAEQVKPLTVKVLNSDGTAINGAQVAVSGGPGTAPGIYVTGVTSVNLRHRRDVGEQHELDLVERDDLQRRVLLERRGCSRGDHLERNDLEPAVEQRRLVHVGLGQLQEPDGVELHHDPRSRDDHRCDVQLRLRDRPQLLVLGDALQEHPVPGELLDR
jgi:Tfp pilus assembly protein PilV